MQPRPEVLPDLAATEALAQALARRLPESALLLLSGPLGAGKTTFVQFLARALGSGAHVSSPTYTLVHEYPSPQGTLVHLDAYRLDRHAGRAQALLDLGLEDYLERARLVVVEWGESLAAHFPDAWLLELSLQDGLRQARLIPGTPPMPSAK